MERHIPCDGLKVLISFGATPKRARGPGQQGFVSTRLEICQQCADEMQANRENAVLRLQAGGLSREDAEAIHGGDAQALRRAMEERGVPAMLPLRRDGRAMSESW